MADSSASQYLAEVALREKILREARRARAEALHRLVFAPLARMIAGLLSRKDRSGRAHGAEARAYERL